MAHVVVMPKLGNTVESCIIVKWNVSEGQAVKADTVLCEIETDKATMDVPAGVEGTLLARFKNEGDDVPVLEPIALIGAAGEKIDPALLG
ncbi:MAG: biotin/lipoyl-containing protein, partial [Rectinemataceae bacterium]